MQLAAWKQSNLSSAGAKSGVMHHPQTPDPNLSHMRISGSTVIPCPYGVSIVVDKHSREMKGERIMKSDASTVGSRNVSKDASDCEEKASASEGLPSMSNSRIPRGRGRECGPVRGGSTRDATPLVVRGHLLQELADRGTSAGVTFITAPDGFGKTTLINQYVLSVCSQTDRGAARVIDASSLDEGQLYESLKCVCEELEPRMRPLVAIDDMPLLGESALEVFPAFFRDMREKGFEFAITCRPNNRALVEAMGDSHKIGPQGLSVRLKEYPDWARSLSISEELDVYKMTQGVPSLVACLARSSSALVDMERYADTVTAVYRGVLGDLRRDRDPLYRTACLLVLGQSGSLRDFERARMRVRSESWSRLAHDYPVFGVDIQHDRYACLAPESHVMRELRRDIARARPLFAVQAARVALSVGEEDRAVDLARMLEQAEDALELIAERPDAFALSGNVAFVNEALQKKGDISSASAPVGLVLAMYSCALVKGEYRTARLMAAEIHRRSDDIVKTVAPEVWMRVKALSRLWGGCPNIDLPELEPSFTHGRKDPVAEDLACHGRTYAELVGGYGEIAVAICPYGVDEVTGESINVPHILRVCDRVLADAFRGETSDARSMDRRLQKLADRLRGRGLAPVAMRVRMVAGICRLLSGFAVIEERTFIDAGAMAVRARDFPTQLICLVGEGWQELEVGHHVNALFRAQQVLKLADLAYGRVVAWARMLECCAFVLNTPRATLVEEASLLDMVQEAPTSIDAWVTACKLAGARLLPELSAWCSLNKDQLLLPEAKVLGRQAIRALGDCARPIERMLPALMPQKPALKVYEPDAEITSTGLSSELHENLGQFHISLFGGFQVARGGHVLTSSIWRRKKVCVLAARLVLAGGAFVNRQLIAEEVWPDKDYRHAREAMYAGLSSLRGAFGQRDEGPQYVLTQGEGVAINGELVSADTMQFDLLARHILLGGSSVSGRQVIEACLKLEELYIGPLYVPNFGNSAYYLRQRRLYVSKFVDCMMRGISIAVELDDLPVASWLVEAAMRHDPLREDVIRAAMRVYDLSGRRREVVELYNSHAHYLEQQLHALPEEETRLAYESIVGRVKERVMLG